MNKGQWQAPSPPSPVTASLACHSRSLQLPRSQFGGDSHTFNSDARDRLSWEGPRDAAAPGPGWRMLVAVETAGPDPGTAAFPCTWDQLLSPSLQLESTGCRRAVLVALGCSQPQSVCSQSHFPQGSMDLPPVTLCMWCTGCFIAQVSLGWNKMLWTWATPSPPATWGQTQPSPQELHGTAWQLQATTSQESLLHQHHSFPQPVHHPGSPKCHPDLRELGHTGTKPCHQPGRGHCVQAARHPGLIPAPLWAAQLLAGMPG